MIDFALNYVDQDIFPIYR